MNSDLKWRDLPMVQRRFIFYSLAVTLVFVLLLLRLWYLQIISHSELQERSVRNRTRVLSLEAPRGPVYDRRGTLLVSNRPAFQISVMRQEVADRDALLARLAQVMDLERAELEQRWEQGRNFPVYRPLPLATDVSREVMERVQEQSVNLPGVLTEVRPVRDYLEKGAAAHVVGYLGEITEEELQSREFADYRGGDYVGKTALEKTLEPYLRGTKGKRLVEVDVQGKLLRQLQVEPPRPGNKVYLTLDRELQEAAGAAFGEQAGAAVVMDVHSGEILAMVSRPTFNPALFARGIAGDEWRTLIGDERHPLQNKAIAGQYPPGSTFKMIVALAALRAGVVDTQLELECNGDFEVANSRFRCWKKQGHGPTDLHKALRESCDVWFYRVGLQLGIDKLSAAAREFGLGAPVGYPLPGERSGTMPSQEWKRKRFNTSWYAGETVIASIGQGYVLTTPLQLATMTAALANGGELLKPRIVRRVEDWNGTVLEESAKEVVRQIDYAPEEWTAIREGMTAVVNSPRGTGQSARLEALKVAGKTGTSQVIRRKSDEEEEATEDEKVPYRFRPHALFVAYAPAEEPEIAVAVVVEHGGSGGRAAGPVVQRILERYAQLREERRSGTKE